ncbi:GAF domain-containing protein [Dinoroseobacter sp. S76]|uniref:GAF domain-containing protein n=1 Tax=Dinoroseobacter sp. S76 TaxID=3415124 RepID=UPI003C797F3F
MGCNFDAHALHVMETVENGASARSRLAASWARSMQTHHLDPSRRQRPERLAARHLADLRAQQEELLRAAGNSLDQLTQAVQHAGCVVLLADHKGRILDHRYHMADAEVFDAVGLVSGGDWSEAAEGTNGIGTCLSEERPLTIHRDEHFSARNIAMTCLSAPIHGAQGDLLAVVDVSSAREAQSPVANEMIGALVQHTAQQIELVLFQTAFPNARMVLADPQSLRSGFLAVDADDIVLGATHGARRNFGLQLRGALAPRPLHDTLGQDRERSGFEKAEYAALKTALIRAGGNASAAARALGVSRATLYRRMKRVGLSPTDLDLQRPA